MRLYCIDFQKMLKPFRSVSFTNSEMLIGTSDICQHWTLQETWSYFITSFFKMTSINNKMNFKLLSVISLPYLECVIFLKLYIETFELLLTTRNKQKWLRFPGNLQHDNVLLYVILKFNCSSLIFTTNTTCFFSCFPNF